MKNARRRAAFSLLEMLVVVIIMGLLVALVAPRLLDKVGASKVTTTKAQIQNLATCVESFYMDVGRYPTQDEGLTVLVKPPLSPEDAKKWKGPYPEKDMVPQDAWGHAFEYVHDEAGRFRIRSLGADGRTGGEDENADLDNRT